MTADTPREFAGLREAAEDLCDFEAGGGFRANHPTEHFRRLREALASCSPDSEISPTARLRAAEEAARLLSELWIRVHYAEFTEHRSVRPGHEWAPNCTDEPCPSIRAALRGAS